MIRLRDLKGKIESDVCCVGVHVHHATPVLALACLIGSSTLLIVDISRFPDNKIHSGDILSYVYFALWHKAYYHVLIDVLINSLWALSSLLLLCGNLRLRASLYWPYIAISYLNICIYALKVPLFVLTGVAVLRGQIEEIPKGGRASTCIQILLLILLNCMILLINGYCVGVVTKAHGFLLRHRQVRSKSMQMEIRKATLHLEGYHAPLDNL